MMRWNRGVVATAFAVATVLFGLSGSSWASSAPAGLHHGMLKSSMHSRGRRSRMADAIASADASAVSMTQEFSLKLKNLHTGESLDVVYRVGDTYIPEAMAKLDYFLRDHNTQDVTSYDPKEFDVLHSVLARLRRPNGVIDVVCGYRTPETNEALREESPHSGVAEHSQHMEGKAIDIRVPGVSTVRLRNAALSLHAGGVGYYPVSKFVHVDVGSVREWSFGRTRRVYRHKSHVRVGD
jgi:uncharacterized protein YcbK (DUF882 family)